MSRIGKALWRGSVDLTEIGASPEWDIEDITTVKRTFNGPYNKCLSDKPARGSEMAGYEGLIITKVRIAKSNGNKGILTVTASQSSGETTVQPGSAGEVTEECDWVEVERPLRTNQAYWSTTMGYPADGPFPLLATDMVALRMWENETSLTYRLTFRYRYFDEATKETVTGTLTASAQKYASKILKGVESWVEYIPILRRRTVGVDSPADSDAGMIQTPEGFAKAIPSEWVYLKTADRYFRSATKGRWERQEAWTGAKEWDTDHYETT